MDTSQEAKNLIKDLDITESRKQELLAKLDKAGVSESLHPGD